ncbi:hypothetical protein NP493_670g01018 [Ridgeia piscesae]|uniref:Uncharacterized protein n=1 Tax=Ridgeia piscesae TaxID=27915 RepID=A0AAD9KRJ5_RIDPI|nr:hypothetical protein NP493_670g01018 [Ridgeia piscesae]
MPGAGPHQEARMSQGQAPRLSVAMAAIEDGDRKSGSRVRDFCCTNIKGIVTVVMLFAMLFCVILIVMGECPRKLTPRAASVACVDVVSCVNILQPRFACGASRSISAVH